VKVSPGKTWAIFLSSVVDALRRRSPLNILSHNQLMLLEKQENLDSEE